MDEYNNFFSDLTAYLIDPHRKTYYLYIISSLCIALVYLFFFNKKTTKYIFYLFNKNHWIGKSPFCDYYLVIINSLIRVFLIIPFFLTGVNLSFDIAKWLMVNFEVPPMYEGSRLPIIIAYTFSLWILADFSRFFLHYLAHKIPLLWEFHKVHHSATVLNPFTLYRQHPVEMFLFHIRGTIVFALVTGIFYYYFSYHFGLIEILGVNIGRFIFLFLGSNLRHSHVPIRYGAFLEHIFISPLQHQIHHSIDKKDHHKNMGSHLAIWDWMFGTLKISEKNKTEYEFGIPDSDADGYHSFAGSIWIPIKNSFHRIVKTEKDNER